jgi:predicted amidohydrolase
MQVPVVVGQLPTTWDPDRNGKQIVAFLDHATGPGDVVVLPEAALSGYDDALSGLRAELELADVRDDYLSQQRGDVVALVQMTS